MAGLKKIRSGRGDRWQISVYFGGVRRYISFAGYSRSSVEELRALADRLATLRATGEPLDRRTLQKLATISDDAKRRFAAAGLIEIEESLTVEELFARLFEVAQYKPNTVTAKSQTLRRLVAYFGEATPIDKIDRRSAELFIKSLGDYSAATVAGTLRDARAAFEWAVDRDLLDVNPFARVRAGSFKNKRRELFISWATFERLLEAAQDQETRALLSLYRVGGLRHVEALELVWRDVDFERDRIRIPSPKTARYEGKSERICPLFPALRKELWALYKERRPNGADRLVKVSAATARRMVAQTVRAAGIEPWTRLLQNLRSSRANEVYREFGAIAESAWLGHSSSTARDHYLHVLASDFERAVAEDPAQNKNPQNDHRSWEDREVSAVPSDVFGGF